MELNLSPNDTVAQFLRIAASAIAGYERVIPKDILVAWLILECLSVT